jgi:nucleoside-diphosphate-sugar epimerase
MSRSATRLIFGCGYVGHRAAKAWQAAGLRVTIVTRSSERTRQFASEGFDTIVANISDRASLRNLPAAGTVLFAVGYDRSPSQSIGQVYSGGLANVLDALSPETGRVIYISSTGVYGDAAGEWIDEETPAVPSRDGGRACLAAEQALFAHPLGQRGVVLRLAGIYGPGRLPRREDLLAGKPIDGSGDGCLNLIHVDDVVRAILAVEKHAAPPRIYNVSDGNPSSRREYYAELSRLLSAPPPVFTGSTLAQRTRGGADKRVSNARMLAELGVKPRFPSFREGLAAILADS